MGNAELAANGLLNRVDAGGVRQAGGRGGSTGEERLIECLPRQGRRHGLAEHRRKGRHARHRSLKAPDVASRMSGYLLQCRRVAELQWALQGHLPQERGSGAEVGGAKLDTKAPAETVAEPLCEPCECLRWAVAREDDLLARGVKCVERVDELVLGALLALERLHVVDQQGVELAVALFEAFGAVPAERADEFGRESLGGRVMNGQLGTPPAQVVDDRA